MLIKNSLSIAFFISALAVTLWLSVHPISFGFGLQFVLGGVVATFCLLHNRIFLAAGCFFLSSLGSWILWNHPYAFIVWGFEGATLIYCFHKKKKNIIICDAVFWIFGIAAIVCFYHFILKQDLYDCFNIAFKQALNAVISIVIATLLFTVLKLTPSKIWSLYAHGEPSKLSYKDIFFVTLVASTSIPSLSSLYIYVLGEEKSVHKSAVSALDIVTRSHNIQVSQSVLKLMKSALIINHDPNQNDSLSFENNGGKKPVVRFLESLEGGGRDTKFAYKSASLEGAHKIINFYNNIDECAKNKTACFVKYEEKILMIYEIADAVYIIAIDREDMEKMFAFEDHLLPHKSAVKFYDIDQIIHGLMFSQKLIVPNLKGKNAIQQNYQSYYERVSTDINFEGITFHSVVYMRDYIATVHVVVYQAIQIVFVAVMGSLLIAYIIVELVVNPLRRMQNIMSNRDSEIQNNHADTDVMVINEVHDLYTSFAQMNDEIRNRNAELERTHGFLSILNSQYPLAMYSIKKCGDKTELVYMSKEIEVILGCSVEECAHLEWWERNIVPEDLQAFLVSRDNLWKNGAVEREFKVKKGDGNIVFLMDRCVVKSMDVEEGVNAIGVIVDITSQKKLDIMMRHSAKLISLGEMSTGIAHELNQPLNVIRLTLDNFSFLLHENGLQNKEQLFSIVDKINKQVLRAAQIIDNMRIYGRVDASVEEPFLLNECIAESVELFSAASAHNNIKINMGEILNVYVVGHKSLFQQVIINIFQNSMQAHAASNKSSQLCIISVCMSRDATYNKINLEISDNGHGFSPLALMRAFEPFYTDKRVGEGTGLGLSIAFGVVREMKGSIEALNHERGGAIVRITLPAMFLD